MNGKRAKQIRRLAEENTPGDAPFEDMVLRNRAGKDVASQGTGVHSPRSVRGVEKAIKKAWKRRHGA